MVLFLDCGLQPSLKLRHDRSPEWRRYRLYEVFQLSLILYLHKTEKSVIISVMPTQRQNMMEILSRGTFTLQELSSELHMSIKEILLHLPHVQKSVRPPGKFIIFPARCLKCGYIFKDRTKLHSPSKCPRCRESHIKEPEYHVEWGARRKKPKLRR